MSQPINASINDVIAEFRTAMFDAGITYHGDIEPDGVLHRFQVEDDKKGRKNGWYVLYIDESPAGQFGCNKRYPDEKLQWQFSGNWIPPTPEERAEIERKRKIRDEQRAKQKAEAEAKAAEMAKNIWDAGTTDVPADHEYLAAKGIKPYGLRYGPWMVWDHDAKAYTLVTKGALYVPLMDLNQRNISSLQAIVPKGCMDEDETNKLFLPRGAKMGRCFRIGTPKTVNNRPVFILCEGYATGASIHEATGHCVIVCFDSGNLVAVARAMAEALKGKPTIPRFVIAGDDDQFTVVKGVPTNAGRTKAVEAMKILGGDVLFPRFSSLDSRPTDFNDMHQLDGLDAVTALFDTYFNPPPVVTANPLDDEDAAPAVKTEFTTEEGKAPEWAHEAAALASRHAQNRASEIVNNEFFRVLGFRDGTYYFYVKEQKSVVAIPAYRFSENMMIQLAPPDFWESRFPAKSGFDKTFAVSSLMRSAAAMGVYDETLVRAPGAWSDKGKLIYHFGTEALVNNELHPLQYVPGKFVYRVSPALVDARVEPFTADEARVVRDISLRLPWDFDVSAHLMAGWAFLAPICGVLPWRPHLWVTGPAGSGKSSVLKFFASVNGGAGHFFLGDSSQAGIRQALRSSAMPVMIDEFESNDPKEKARVESILAMARQASSDLGAKTAKGSANGDEQTYLVPSMFCLGSINVNINKKADADRITVLDLHKDDSDEGVERWEETDMMIRELVDGDDLSSRWVMRPVTMMQEVLKAIAVFRRVGLKAFGTQRNTDQFGTLMAGDYMIDHDHAPSDQQALDYLAQFSWSLDRISADDEDARKALSYLINSAVRTSAGVNISVASLITVEYNRLHGVSLPVSGNVAKDEATSLLSNHGMRYVNSKRAVAVAVGDNFPALNDLVSKASFSTNLTGQLGRLPGATRNVPYRITPTSKTCRCVMVPISLILEVPGEQDELPI